MDGKWKPPAILPSFPVYHKYNIRGVGAVGADQAHSVDSGLAPPRPVCFNLAPIGFCTPLPPDRSQSLDPSATGDDTPAAPDAKSDIRHANDAAAVESFRADFAGDAQRLVVPESEVPTFSSAGA